MRKILLILFLIPLFTFAQNEQIISETIDASKDYKREFLDDGGTLESDHLVKAAYLQAFGSDMMDSVKFMWLGESSSAKRTSTIYDYYTKIYDASGLDNHGTQTTEANQPYVSGNIAPTEHEGAKNPNGDTRYFTHPEISFASTDEWSVTTVVNPFNLSGGWWGSITGSKTLLSTNYGGNGKFGIITVENVGFGGGIAGITYQLIGKNSCVSFVKSSTEIKIYINGIYADVINVNSSSTFNLRNILTSAYSVSSNNAEAIISAHIIRSQALTPTQVAAEHAFLQELYPEIPSVQIGTQTWSTSNWDGVATPQGNVFTNVTDATEWSNATVVYDSVYAATAGTAAEKEQAALEASAYWCYPNNDSQKGSWAGKLYNYYAAKLLQTDIDTYNAANDPDWGYHVPTQAEFTTLQTYLGGSTVAGGKMKVEGTDYWNSPNTGADNSSGFSAVQSGERSASNGSFFAADASFWTITEYYRSFLVPSSSVFTIQSVGVSSTPGGFSIRLIKD